MLTQEAIRKNLEKQKVIRDIVDIARSRVAKDFFQVNELELKLGEPLLSTGIGFSVGRLLKISFSGWMATLSQETT